MFIPLKDLNPRVRPPVVTVLLIAANIASFLYTIMLPPQVGQALVYQMAMVPARIPLSLLGHGVTLAQAFLPFLTSMFLHSGALHLAGNMLFLWVFGDNVEDYLGHFEYLLFYVVCGVGAGLTHTLINLNSTLPALGASGAVSGVMGAYLVLYPRARVLTLIFIFLIPVPAIIVLGSWFVLQFLGGLDSLGRLSSGGVAWFAHIGGFLLGMFLVHGSKRR